MVRRPVPKLVLAQFNCERSYLPEGGPGRAEDYVWPAVLTPRACGQCDICRLAAEVKRLRQESKRNLKERKNVREAVWQMLSEAKTEGRHCGGCDQFGYEGEHDKRCPLGKLLET